MIDLETYAIEVIAAVCKRHGIERDDLVGHGRRCRACGHVSKRTGRKSRNAVRAREDACRLFRATVAVDESVMPAGIWDGCKPLSYPHIGRLLHIHHSTAILAERRGMVCENCKGFGRVLAYDGWPRNATTLPCPFCGSAGKKPPLTWDAYNADGR